MKAHLLSWTLGPAMLAALLACGGADPPPMPASDIWRGFLSGALGLACLIGAFHLIFLVLHLIAHRLNAGRLNWTEVRIGAVVMSVQGALLVVVFTVLFAVHQCAVIVTGGWSRGWLAAACGAVVGAALGFVLGLGVAWLRLPQRLGLDAAADASDGQAGSKNPSESRPANG